MQRARSISLGFRSSCPPGHNTIGNCPGSTWNRSINAFASGSVSGFSRWRGWPLRARKPSSRSTSPLSGRPTITGPPAPASSRPTRRRIRARMIRSPEFRFCYQQRPEPVRRNDQSLGRFQGVGVHQSPPARQLSQFAHECAGAVGDDHRARARPVVLGDLDFPGQDDGQAVTYLAHLDQGFAHAIRTNNAKPPYPLDLRRLQDGEHLVASCVDNRWRRSRHGHFVVSTSVRPRRRSAVTAERNFPGAVRPLRGGSQMDLSWALSIGSFRIRLPVVAKIALATAGITADVPGSPTPPGASVLLTRWTSIKGASLMRSIR
jgi:hypothetical protein